MTPLVETEIAPSIAVCMENVRAAKRELVAELESVQAKCEHRVVSEIPWKGLDYFAPLNAKRICNHCRLIEEGSHWSGGSTWSRKDYGTAVLGNEDGRIVLTIDRDTFYGMRAN